jgi:16S rRNA processing protein RimM
MTNQILIAKVNSIFGIKGEVKLIIFSDDPKNIEKYQLFDAKGNQLKIKISNKNKTVVGTSLGNPIVIAKIDGINDRNAAEAIHGLEIFANRDDFDELDENEFYYSDLVGLDVVDENSKKIGVVKGVMDFGAGGVIEVEFIEKLNGLEKSENFSFKNEIFPEVNLKKNFIRLEIPHYAQLPQSSSRN